MLELMTDGRTRFDQRLAALGPDVLAQEFDEQRFLRRLREDDQTRTIGDALLDQRTVAGIGNIWKAESCWGAAIDPWRRLRDLRDEEALALIVEARSRMRRAVAARRHDRSDRNVYERTGMPCPRCRTRIRARGQGEDNRTTFWCPGCQR